MAADPSHTILLQRGSTAANDMHLVLLAVPATPASLNVSTPPQFSLACAGGVVVALITYMCSELAGDGRVCSMNVCVGVVGRPCMQAASSTVLHAQSARCLLAALPGEPKDPLGE